MACVKATVTLSKVVLSTSAKRCRCFGEDCCGGVSFCEGEGVIGGGVIGGIEIEVGASLTATTVMVEVVVLEASPSPS